MAAPTINFSGYGRTVDHSQVPSEGPSNDHQPNPSTGRLAWVFQVWFIKNLLCRPIVVPPMIILGGSICGHPVDDRSRSNLRDPEAAHLQTRFQCLYPYTSRTIGPPPK
jgi:hypothetical protein